MSNAHDDNTTVDPRSRVKLPAKQVADHAQKRLADYLRSQKSTYSATLTNDSREAAKVAIELLAGIKPAFYIRVLADVTVEDLAEDMFSLSESLGFQPNSFMSNVVLRGRDLHYDSAGQHRRWIQVHTKPSLRGLWGQWDYLQENGEMPEWFRAMALDSESRVIEAVMSAIRADDAAEATAHGRPLISPLLKEDVLLPTARIAESITRLSGIMAETQGWRVGQCIQRGSGGIGTEIAQMLSGPLHGAGISYRVVNHEEKTGHASLLLKRIKARKERSF